MKLLNARKKLVTLAVASAVTAGAAVMTAPAHAMNISQNNLGQVLLFPYYTVKNGYDTYMSLVNTSGTTVVVKVRWREALNSRETRDFNVILSPYDVWTAGVTSDGAGGALVRTFDNTCTSPALPADGTGGRSIAFTNAAFSSTNPNSPFRVDGGGTDISRVQEGYFEVIAMAQSINDGSSASTNVVEYNAKHVSGVPRDCSKVDATFLDAGSITAAYQTSNRFTAPGNVLKGSVTYIDVATGKAIDATPTAIEDWVTNGGNWSVGNNVFAPGDLQPSLANGDVGATINYLQDGQANNAVIPAPEDAVTALLSADNVINEFAANGVGTFTDWVVTFPTKHHYTDLAYTTNAGDAPFAQNFAFDTDGNPAAAPYVLRGKSCDNISMTVYDREERSRTGGTQFSPSVTPTAQLCYEANVVTFNNSHVFGTGVNHSNVNTSDVGVNGWMRMGLTNTGNVAPGFTGLPAIGFAALIRNNAAEAGNNRNYGSAQPHAFTGGKP